MHLRLPLALLVLAAGLTAQTTASYTLFGTGCNSATPSNCMTFNDQGITLTVSSLPNEYAYPVINTSGQPVQVIGFEVFTVTNGVIASATGKTGIIRDNSGAGATVHTQPSPTLVANGNITVVNTQAWYSTNTYPPVTVAAGEAFWLQMDAYSMIAPPQNSAGVLGPTSNWYRRPSNNMIWTVSVSVTRPIYRVHCLPVSPTVPSLINTGTPVIGGSFNLAIAGGVPATAAFMISAFNNTTWASMPLPVNLGIFGAPNCFNYTSTDSAILYVLDGQGGVTVPWSIPNNATLSGFPFFNQAATIAPGANPLGLLATNAGAGVVGS